LIFLIKFDIIISIVLAKPLNNAQISESFLYKDLDMGKILFNKPAICVKDQIKLLKSRDLVIADENFAEEILSNITYYRLSAYMKYFQKEDKFFPNITFNDIVELYNFDKELKLLIFEYIRLLEVSLRAKICLHMCTKYGSHWFYNKNNFKSDKDYKKTLEILENEKGLKKDTFIKYYFEKYSEPNLPPFWMISEVLSMGDLSKILSGLNFKDLKEIAKYLTPNYFTYPVLANWIHVLATIRNICAHHSRLWNRQLKIKFSEPQKIDEWQEKNIQFDKLSAVCFVISILLEKHPYNNFNEKLNELFSRYPNIDFTQMGFIKN